MTWCFKMIPPDNKNLFLNISSVCFYRYSLNSIKAKVNNFIDINVNTILTGIEILSLTKTKLEEFLSSEV